MSLTGFAAPWWFLLFVAVAAIAAGYLLAQRARRKRVLRFANLPLLDRVAPRALGRRRHLPAALLVVSLSLFSIGMAGPTADQRVPRNRATVMLVIDVSLSMQSTDIVPTRLQAAQEAARTFVRDMPAGINVGLVSFAGTATTLVAPTVQRDSVIRQIDTLKLAPSTATGEGIYAALQAIDGLEAVLTGPDGPPPARIVLMTDGKETVPEDLNSPRGCFTAAQAAKQHNIPIAGISFGTTDGTVDIDGHPVPVPVDDDAVRQTAELSGGQFYKAASAQEIKQVYADLGEQIGYETRKEDDSRPWMTVGLFVLIAASVSSLLLGQRLP